MSLRYEGSLIGLFGLTLLACSGGGAGDGGAGASGSETDGGPDATATTSTVSSTSTGHQGGDAGSTSSVGGGNTNGPSTGVGGSNVGCSGKTTTPGDATFTVTVEGAERAYRVHAPPSYDPAVGMPLVVAYHGYLQSTNGLESSTHLSAAADEQNYLIAYPSGQIAGWNAGSCCGTAPQLDVPDVAVSEAILDQISTDYCVDDKRVYATGFSNGAMMSYRVACELTDRFAAIAAVSGTLAIPPCSLTRPMPVLHFHGTSDNVVPYEGGFPSNVSPVAETIAHFVSSNSCAADSVPTITQGDASCEAWCADSARVELCTLGSGGHQWPGGESNPGGGQVNMDVDASALILEFFSGFALP